MLDDDTTTGTTTAPDALASKLGNLKERRREVFEAQVLERRVPRWTDPLIYVRYKPVEHALIRSGINRIDNAPPQKRSGVEVDVNCALLATACLGVFAKMSHDEDEPEYSLRPSDPHGELTRFDAALAENLGLDDKAQAKEVIKALFIVDGDILAHARAVAEFSGYREKEADDDLLGE